MNAVLEYGAAYCMLFSADCPGAYARARTKQEAMAKLPADISAFCRWAGYPARRPCLSKLSRKSINRNSMWRTQTETCSLTANVLPDTGRIHPARALVLRSAQCLDALYAAIPNPDTPLAPARTTFYGAYPNTARAMFDHVNNCTGYYTAALGAECPIQPRCYDTRLLGLEAVEALPGYLTMGIHTAPGRRSMDAAQADAPLSLA